MHVAFVLFYFNGALPLSHFALLRVRVKPRHHIAFGV